MSSIRIVCVCDRHFVRRPLSVAIIVTRLIPHMTVCCVQVVASYGADSLRLHLMFMGPLEAVKAWNTSTIDGYLYVVDAQFTVSLLLPPLLLFLLGKHTVPLSGFGIERL